MAPERGRNWPAAALFGGALALLAIPVAGADSQPSVIRRDSAGVTIIETAGEVAAAPLGWVVDSAPDLDFAPRGGGGVYPGRSITGLAQVPSGRLVVVDSRNADVRLFDDRGAFIESIGRSGRGPVDFTSAVLIASPSYDSVLIADSPERRIVVLGPGGTWHSSTGVPVRLSGQLWQMSPRRVLKRTGVVILGPEGVQQHESSYWLVDLESGSEEIIAILERQVAHARPDPDRNMSFQVDLPFVPAPSATAGFDAMYLATGTLPEIRRHDSTGRLRALIRVRRELEPVTKDEYDHAVEDRALQILVTWEAAFRRVLAQFPVPATKPAWERLVVDVDGHLWAETFRSDSASRSVWTVFAPDGTALGTVDLPPDLHVMQIGSDFVVGRWTDSSRSQRVRRYGLDRRGYRPSAVPAGAGGSVPPGTPPLAPVGSRTVPMRIP